MADSNALSKRLDFDEIDQTTRAVLRENSAFIIIELPKVLDHFYRHISNHAEAAVFFRDRAHMDHAKDAQVRHWTVIANGRFDESYMASVTKIGEAHARLGLEPQVYIGGWEPSRRRWRAIARPQSGSSCKQP
jgi:GTP-sensing pleiotropic transcriptional regulator CodY